MKILFTTPVLEVPAAGGSQLRVENSIKALAQLAELHLISRSPPSVAGGAAVAAFYSPIVAKLEVIPTAVHLSANKYVRKLQRIWANLGGRNTRKEAKFLIDYADAHGITLLWFGYGNISYPLMREVKRQRPEFKIVCDTDSIWSRFVLRALPYAKGLRKLWIYAKGKLKEREERAWVNMCDVTTAVSEIDAEVYRSLARDPSRVMLFSNVIDTAVYAMKPPPAEGLKTPCVFLAGTYGHAMSPMDVATRWVLEEVWPLVLKQMPNAHFYIVGKRSDESFGYINRPDVTVTGMLPSVLPYLCYADCAIVPLKFESGTRFKILEAGACGVPLVSTTLGAEGLPVRHEQEILIADEPQEFADAIVRVMRDNALAARLAAACKILMERDYSIQTLLREGAEILKRL